MKISNLRKFYFLFFLVIFIGTVIQPQLAKADGSDGFGQMFKMFFGSEESRGKQHNCSTSDDDSANERGMMGMINGIFCHLEKDMGINGTGNATKTFRGGPSGGNFSVTVKCSIAANSSGSYTNSASCWVCTGSSCSSSSSFNRLMTLQWSYQNDKTVNKGEVLMDNQAFGGTAGQSAMNIVYDLGTSTSTKTITAKNIFGSNKMRADAEKTGSVTKVTIIMGGLGRFMGAMDTSAQIALDSFESTGGSSCTNGFRALQASATSDTPTCTACHSRARSGTDFSYSGVSNSQCSSLTAKAFPSESATDVSNYTVSSVLTGTLGAWNGMAATPSF